MRDESDLTPLEVLRSVFSYPTFRPHQQQIVEVALAGRDVLAVMPTSAGKSVCYQVPALVRATQGAGATVVVSPLISLMADQVQALAQADVAAACLNSAMAAEDRAAVLEDVRRGRLSHSSLLIPPAWPFAIASSALPDASPFHPHCAARDRQELLGLCRRS